MTLLLAEKTGLHTGVLLDGKASAGAPGTLGSMKIPCVVEVDFISISLLSILRIGFIVSLQERQIGCMKTQPPQSRGFTP